MIRFEVISDILEWDKNRASYHFFVLQLVFGLVIKEITQANHKKRENCNKPIANACSAGKILMASHVALGFFLIGRESGNSFVVVVVSRVSLLLEHKVKDPGNKVSFPRKRKKNVRIYHELTGIVFLFCIMLLSDSCMKCLPF